MNESWRRCVEEFEEARREIGVLGALAYVTMVGVSILVALAVILILGRWPWPSRRWRWSWRWRRCAVIRIGPGEAGRGEVAPLTPGCRSERTPDDRLRCLGG